MKNKFLLILLSIFLSITLISCGDTKTESPNSNPDTSTTDNKDNLPVDDTKKFEESTTLDGASKAITEKSIRIFLYDGAQDKLYFKNETVQVTDGALVTATLTALKKDRGANFCTLPLELGVKSAKLDKANDIITVNFGGKFVNNMNLGSGAESNVLKAIVNTIGYNFGVSKVYITIDGKEYSSGHILMEAGEAFKVDYQNTTEIK